MRNCEHRRKLSVYHDGELSTDARRAIEAHLRGCAQCRAELEDIRRIARGIVAARVPPLRAGVLAEVHGALDAACRNGVLRLAEGLTAAAFALLVASLALLAHRTPATGGGPGDAEEWEAVVAAGWADTSAAEEPEVQLAREFFSEAVREARHE